MHLLLAALLLFCCHGARAWAQSSPEPAGPPISASSSLDTTWHLGPGPRLPAPMGARAALTEAPPPVSYGPERAIDGDPATAWVPSGEGPEEWIRLDLGRERFVSGITVIGGGALGTESPTVWQRIRVLSVAPPSGVVDLPARSLDLKDVLTPQTFTLYGAAYDALNLTIEEVWPADLKRTPLSEVSVSYLPLEPAAVRAALELPEGTSVSAVRYPGRGDAYLIAWSGPDQGKLRAELAGVAQAGDGARVLWRQPIPLQYRGAESVDIKMEPLSLGPPGILMGMRFMDAGVRLDFVRAYVMRGDGAHRAWETSLSQGSDGTGTRLLRIEGGRAYLRLHDADLGYGMVEEVFRYDAGFGEFEPAPNVLPGVTASARGPGGAISGLERVFNPQAGKPLIVNGDGVGTEITLTFKSPRRISAVQMFPGVASATEEGSSGYTRPATVTLTWPNGHTYLAELEDAAEVQTLYEGWEGAAAEPTTSLSVRISSVYPALPGKQMAITQLQVYFLDPP